MKKLNALLLSGLLSLSFVQTTFADEMPSACPAFDVIKKANFLGMQEDKEDNLYIAYQINKYATPSVWAFIIGVPFDQATSKGDAMNKAKAALATLSGVPTPSAMDEKNKQWYCMYDNDYHYLAVSVTPLSMSTTMPHSILNVKK